MKIILSICTLLIFTFSFGQNDTLEGEKLANVKHIIRLFKEKDISKIIDLVNYPLRRAYPIRSIQNKNELRDQFNEVFDEIIVGKIANSTPDQWSEMGWRGIMLDDGVIWIDSYEGRIIAVNYESDFEKNKRLQLIAQEKEQVHSSLSIFDSPVYKIETEHYRIRIDEFQNSTYRYAAWKISEQESAKPDLILKNGNLKFQGSGGNHLLTFKSGLYSYKIYRNLIGEKDTPEITLEVEKNGKVILREGGKLIGR